MPNFRFFKSMVTCPLFFKPLFSVSLIAISLLLANVLVSDLASAAPVKGDFRVLTSTPEQRSTTQVVIEEYINFTCPHCHSFREQFEPIRKKYGKRIKLMSTPILFRGQTEDAIRLFYVARRHGKEQLAVQTLFDATFKMRVNINDPNVILYLAKTIGLDQLYQQQAQQKWVTNQIAQANARKNKVAVTGTPTLVVQNTLVFIPERDMSTFIGEVDSVIKQLLK